MSSVDVESPPLQGSPSNDILPVLKRHSSCFETTVPLKTLLSAHTFVSEGLLKHSPCFSGSFPEFQAKFHAHTLFFQALHFHCLKKSQAGHCNCLLQWL
jgi:hypothetical protein